MVEKTELIEETSKRGTFLEEATPAQVKAEPGIETDVKAGEEIENQESKEEKPWLKNGQKKSLPEGNKEEET